MTKAAGGGGAIQRRITTWDVGMFAGVLLTFGSADHLAGTQQIRRSLARSGGRRVTSYRRSPMPPPTVWPSRLPAFLRDAVRFGADGTLWVQRTTADANAPLSDNLIGPAATVVGRLTLPANTRLVGFGSGTVYLVRVDADDLEYLQRYRLP